MSEEYQQPVYVPVQQPERPGYSAFWPMLIFLIAFLLSCFYQLAQVFAQRDLISRRYNAEVVNLPKAQDAQNRLVALVNDLVTTSAKDPNAAQIVQEAKQAGILHDKPGAAGSTGGQ
jgi:hypothetical protein